MPEVVIKIGAKNRIRRFHADRAAELSLWSMTSPLLCQFCPIACNTVHISGGNASGL